MSDFVLDNAYGAIGAVLYSQPIKLGDMNALSVELTVISGTTGASSVIVELSNDLTNWSNNGVAVPGVFTSVVTGPNFARGNFTGISARFARIKLTVGSTAGIFNVSAVPNKV